VQQTLDTEAKRPWPDFFPAIDFSKLLTRNMPFRQSRFRGKKIHLSNSTTGLDVFAASPFLPLCPA
jgi:hypothetical protein